MNSNRYEKIPSEVKEQGNFCLWKYEEIEGRKTKVPYQVNGKRADTSDINTFSKYEIACQHIENYDGIALGVFKPFVVVDIDDCVVGGKLTEMARDVILNFKSYTEYSPSKKGIRIIATIEKFNYDKSEYYINNRKNKLEIYVHGCTNKCLTLTGYQLEDFNYSIRKIDNETLISVLDKYMTKPKNVEVREIGDVPGSVLTDEEVVKRALKAKNGKKFKDLWEGEYARINTDESQQEYDLALCSILAFWCGGDIEQMDRLFRESGLYREKWERDDYRMNTLEMAVKCCSSFYKPKEIYKTDASNRIFETLKEICPESNARYSDTDLGFGRLFADVFKEKARYVPERKMWFAYDGKRWQPDVANLKTMEMCKSLADALLLYVSTMQSGETRKSWLKICSKWEIRRNREIYIREAQSVYPISMSEFDTDKYLLNCNNGTLNLKNLKFSPHNSNDKLTRLSPVNFDPFARYGRWNNFIKEIMCNDDEKAMFLQKSLGYGISGDTRHECMFIFYGELSRNGKGTLMESILGVIGDYGCATRPETIALKSSVSSHGPTEDIARLAGKRFANISEPDKSLKINASQVKTMTGNDTLNARFLNENSFDYKPQFKLYVNTNYLPIITDLTLFYSGRIHVIPFSRRFNENEQDRTLKDEFSRPETQSAILNWLVEGFSMMDKDGLIPPNSVKEATMEYENGSNKMGQFAEECLKKVEGDKRVKTSEVYKVYKSWCERNGYYAENNRNFISELRKIGTVSRKRPSGYENKTTVLIGYELIDEFEYF